MSDAGNWNWVNEIPPAWEPPAELTVPTRSPRINLVVLLLSTEIIGNDIVELLGEYLVEQSRLTMWIYQQEPPMTLRDQTLIGQLMDSVYQRWLAFQSAFRASGGLVGTYENEREALSATLRNGNDVLREARGQSVRECRHDPCQ